MWRSRRIGFLSTSHRALWSPSWLTASSASRCLSLSLFLLSLYMYLSYLSSSLSLFSSLSVSVSLLSSFLSSPLSIPFNTPQPPVPQNPFIIHNNNTTISVLKTFLPHCRTFTLRVPRISSYLGDTLDTEASLQVTGYLNTLVNGGFHPNSQVLSSRPPFILRTRHELTFAQLVDWGHLTMRYKAKGERSWVSLHLEEVPFNNEVVECFAILVRPTEDVPPESQISVKIQGERGGEGGCVGVWITILFYDSFHLNFL